MAGPPEPAWWQQELARLGQVTAPRARLWPPLAFVEYATANLAQSETGLAFLRASGAIEVASAAALSALPLEELPDETILDLTLRGRDPRIVEAFGTRWYLFDHSVAREEDCAEAAIAHATVTWLRTAVEQGGIEKDDRGRERIECAGVDALRAWRPAARGAQLCEALLWELHRRMAKKRTDYALANLVRHPGDSELAAACCGIVERVAKKKVKVPKPWEVGDLLNEALAKRVRASQERATVAAEALAGQLSGNLLHELQCDASNLREREAFRHPDRHADAHGVQLLTKEHANPREMTATPPGNTLAALRLLPLAEGVGQHEQGPAPLVLLPGQEKRLSGLLGPYGVPVLRIVATGLRDPLRIANALGIQPSAVRRVLQQARQEPEVRDLLLDR